MAAFAVFQQQIVISSSKRLKRCYEIDVRQLNMSGAVEHFARPISSPVKLELSLWQAVASLHLPLIRIVMRSKNVGLKSKSLW